MILLTHNVVARNIAIDSPYSQPFHYFTIVLFPFFGKFISLLQKNSAPTLNIPSADAQRGIKAAIITVIVININMIYSNVVESENNENFLSENVPPALLT